MSINPVSWLGGGRFWGSREFSFWSVCDNIPKTLITRGWLDISWDEKALQVWWQRAEGRERGCCSIEPQSFSGSLVLSPHSGSLLLSGQAQSGREFGNLMETSRKGVTQTSWGTGSHAKHSFLEAPCFAIFRCPRSPCSPHSQWFCSPGLRPEIAIKV